MMKSSHYGYSIFLIGLWICSFDWVVVYGSPVLFSSDNHVKQQQQQQQQQQQCQFGINEEDEDQTLIQCYLLSSSNGEERQFHVQGWRWHTLSLVRDAERLETLAQRLATLTPSSNNGNVLRKGVSHVLDFNYKGLRRVESELFLPWLREKLYFDDKHIQQQQHLTTTKSINRAFQNILGQLEYERDQIETVVEAMKEQVEIVTRLSENRSSMAEVPYLSATRNIAQLSSDLKFRVRNMMEKQDKFIVPAVASIVSEKEQHSFNNKVIRKLGILDSRIHLVGMYDTVWNLNDKRERQLFQESIPAIPRYMIPRWKKSLYLPQTDVLDESYPLS